jgi:hypothetical protein
MKLADQQRARLLGRMIYASWGWGVPTPVKYPGTYITYSWRAEVSQLALGKHRDRPQSVAKNFLTVLLWCS